MVLDGTPLTTKTSHYYEERFAREKSGQQVLHWILESGLTIGLEETITENDPTRSGGVTSLFL